MENTFKPFKGYLNCLEDKNRPKVFCLVWFGLVWFGLVWFFHNISVLAKFYSAIKS